MSYQTNIDQSKSCEEYPDGLDYIVFARFHRELREALYNADADYSVKDVHEQLIAGYPIPVVINNYRIFANDGINLSSHYLSGLQRVRARTARNRTRYGRHRSIWRDCVAYDNRRDA